MRRIIILLSLVFISVAIANAKTISQRVGNLETRVGKNEKRITVLEKKSYKGNAKKETAVQADPKKPIITYYISAVNKNVGNKMGVVITLVIENSISKPIYAFSGDFLFRDSKGTAFFKYPYIQSDALYGYKRARILIPVDSSKYPKAYLRFVKDKNITATLENQSLY
ncbi:MAG: hypothetical protein J5706_04150 [Elusimicrobiales bacterium]|nr:hypothetical protein [Elusimicrobiales bacterium]